MYEVPQELQTAVFDAVARIFEQADCKVLLQDSRPREVEACLAAMHIQAVMLWADDVSGCFASLI